MKTLLKVVLIMVLVIVLATGCTQQAAEPTSTKPLVFKDGTYSLTGETEGKSSVPEITITVAGGKITAVKYDESIAMTKSAYIEYQNSFKAQKNIDLLAVYNSMQNNLIKTQDVEKLDTVAGATKSAANLKLLATEALKDAKDGTNYKDGNYTATGVIDEKYWTPIVDITIKDGKITIVKYDEISSKVFKNKSQDRTYIDRFKKLKKIDLTAVYDLLQKSLIEKQDPSKIDSITGATSTSTNFIELAKKVIKQAI
jgi:major membrane immunogen (membrane-anchored lipoprotein)